MKRSVDKGGGEDVSVTLAAFGKHPAQNEHISSLGGQTARIGELYRVLYVAGIPALLRRWDSLVESQRCPFDHWLVLAYPKAVLVARLVASSDRSGRADHPFVAVADVEGASLSAICGGFLEPFDAFVKRCHSFPSISVLRAALTNEQGALSVHAKANEKSAGPSIPLTSRSRFFDETNFGENGVDFGRIVYTVENRWAPYAPARGGRLPRMEGNGVALRFPAVSGAVASNVLLWEEFALSRVHEDVPRMYVVPAAGSWLDLVIGPADVAHFYGLGVNRLGMPVETDVPYPITTDQASAAAKVFDLWRDGHLVTPSGGSVGPGGTVRMTRPETPEPSVESVPSVPSVPSSPGPKTGGFPLWGKLGLGVSAIASVVVAAMLLRSGSSPISVAKIEPRKVEPGKVVDASTTSHGEASSGKLVSGPSASSGQPKPQPPSTPRRTALDDSLDKATAAFQQKQFLSAWHLVNDILGQQPTNPVALELFRKLKQPISIIVDDVTLDAGGSTNLEVSVSDPLGQTLLPRAELSQATSGDQLTWTNSQWVFSSIRGSGRTNHLRWSVSNAITHVAVESLAIVRPDSRTLADEAFNKRNYPEALAQYAKLSGPEGADPTVRDRIGKILSAPSIAKLETLKVLAGSEVTFKVVATDVLDRHVTIKAASGGVSPIMGKLVPSAIDGEWKFSAAPAAEGTLPITFTVENGQTTNSVVVSIEISKAVREPTRVEIARTSAEDAWKRNDFDAALAFYQKIADWDPSEKAGEVGKRIALLTTPATVTISGQTNEEAGTRFQGEVLVQPPVGLSELAHWDLEFNTNKWERGAFLWAPDGRWTWEAPAEEPINWEFSVRAVRGKIHSPWIHFALRSTAPAQKAKPLTQPIAKKTNEFSESDFVWIRSDRGGPWEGKSGPGVWLGRTAVSRKEFEQTMGSSPSTTGISGLLPVTNVSSQDAQTYCQKLTDREKARISSGWEFRLPTSDEWYAAAGGGEVPLLPSRPKAMIPVTGEDGGFTNGLGLINILGNIKEMVLIEDNKVGSMGFPYSVGSIPPRIQEMAPVLYNPSGTVGFRIAFAPIKK